MENAPEVCPVCNHKQSFFEIEAKTYRRNRKACNGLQTVARFNFMARTLRHVLSATGAAREIPGMR